MEKLLFRLCFSSQNLNWFVSVFLNIKKVLDSERVDELAEETNHMFVTWYISCVVWTKVCKIVVNSDSMDFETIDYCIPEHLLYAYWNI